jgi:uncharacterized protein (DUF2062 family)
VRRENVARAFAIGLFIAFLPIPPHSAWAPLAALALRANIPVAFATVWISNPFTVVPITFFAYWLGTVILRMPMSHFAFELTWDWMLGELPYVWKPLLTGSLLLSIIAATLGYSFLHWIWRRGILFRYHRRRRALERQASANVQKSPD